MKRLYMATLGAVLALPAAANEGADLHPHGVEPILGPLLALLAAAAIWLAVRR